MFNKRKWLHLIILLIADFLVLSSSAQEKSDRSGLAVQAGVGSLYAGAGIMIEYQFTISRYIQLDPFIAIGSQAPFTEIPGRWWGYSSGLNLHFGKSSFENNNTLNWFVGLNYGSQGVGADDTLFDNSGSSNLYFHEHLLTGFSLIAGYKFINHCGFIFQVNIGIGYVQNLAGHTNPYSFKPTGGFGIGYKF